MLEFDLADLRLPSWPKVKFKGDFLKIFHFTLPFLPPYFLCDNCTPPPSWKKSPPLSQQPQPPPPAPLKVKVLSSPPFWKFGGGPTPSAERGVVHTMKRWININNKRKVMQVTFASYYIVIYYSQFNKTVWDHGGRNP